MAGTLPSQSHHTFVTDRFAIRIEFDAGDITGWPNGPRDWAAIPVNC